MAKTKRKTAAEKQLEIRLDAAIRLGNSMREQLGVAQSKIRELEHAATQRIDTSMIIERRLLMSSLGHLTESISKAITMVVGKEVM